MARQSLLPWRSLSPPAAALGPVPGQLEAEVGGMANRGWHHCLPAGELAGGLRSMSLLCQRAGRMSPPTVLWGAPGGQGLGAAAIPLPPLHVMLLERMGSGSSRHNCEPTSSACLPVVHPARCGARGACCGHGARWSHCCVALGSCTAANDPSQHKKLALSPGRRCRARLWLYGAHTDGSSALLG